MTERISLVEQYENKDMIVQVKKCLDQTAEAVTVSTEARDTAAASATQAQTASQNANAASTQAQTAAATVATYGTRLDAVEDQSAGNRSSIQTIDGEITDIYNDLTNVVRKVAESGQVVMNGLDLRGTNSVPNTTIGQSDARPANGKRVIDELNAYQPMVRTTGNQDVLGIKMILSINSLGVKNTTGASAWFVFSKLRAYTPYSAFSYLLSSRNEGRSGFYSLHGTSPTHFNRESTAQTPASFKVVTDGTSHYMCVLVGNNEIIRLTQLFQCDSFERTFGDMVDVGTPYLVTNEEDVQWSD